MDSQKYKFTIHELPPAKVMFCRLIEEEFNVQNVSRLSRMYDYIENNLPCILIDGIDLQKAERIKEFFDHFEDKVSIDQSETLHPMLIHPDALIEFETKWFRKRPKES